MGVLLIFIALCALVARLGKNREIGYWWSFVVCLFLSPLLGLIIILLTKKKRTDYIDMSKH